MKLGNIHPSLVGLNVGGRRFLTYCSTLEKIESTFLTALVSGDFDCVQDEKGVWFLLRLLGSLLGYLFIDRNPTYFEPILDYLRTSIWKCPPDLDEETFLAEGQFYGVVQNAQPKKPRIHAAPQTLPKYRFSDEVLSNYLQQKREEKIIKRQKEIEQRKQAEEVQKNHYATAN
jgi:hypothetical protein